jgi:hypothetical protein
MVNVFYAGGVRNTPRIEDRMMIMSDFKVLRIGFDTVIVAFRATLPVELRDFLRDAKARARDCRSDEPVELGPGQVVGAVLAHGVHGGYDVVFSTGHLGELWQFKTEQKGDAWPLRMKVRSAALLVHGYPDAVDFGLARLGDFGIAVQDARLSEVHICVDVLTDDAFRLSETQLIRPGRAIVKPWEVFDKGHPLVDADTPWDVQRVLRGLRLQSLAIGWPAHSIIYDKRAEVSVKRNYMFFEAYKLNRSDPSWGLWRFEARFRGDTLKQLFRVRTFDTLNHKISKMIDWATQRVRYVEPDQQHIHPTRRALDPLWMAVRRALPRLSAAQPSIILPSLAQIILNREKMNTLEASASGAIIARAAMSGKSVAEIQAELPRLAATIAGNKIRRDPDRVRKSIERAIKRQVAT